VLPQLKPIIFLTLYTPRPLHNLPASTSGDFEPKAKLNFTLSRRTGEVDGSFDLSFPFYIRSPAQTLDIQPSSFKNGDNDEDEMRLEKVKKKWIQRDGHGRKAKRKWRGWQEFQEMANVREASVSAASLTPSPCSLCFIFILLFF